MDVQIQVLCPHAWHGGLTTGMLVECRLVLRHRGAHRNAKGDLSWSGKLTDEEMLQASRLRVEAGARVR